MESTECGAASLGIILAYYGRFVALPELRIECRVSRDGSNALYVKKTAERYGLVGKGYQMSVDELRTLKPPFMVFWGMNHFLVVEGFGAGRVYLNDPASGRRAVSDQAFRAAYTGIVFQFEPGPQFKKGGERPSAWRGIVRRLSGARAAVGFVVLAGVAFMLAELVSSTFGLVFVDQLLIESRRHWIRPLLLAMALCALFRAGAMITQRGMLRRLKLRLAMVHSAKFLWHVLRLPVAFYQQRFAGDLSARVDGNSEVADMVAGDLATTAVGLLMIVFYASLMFAFDPWLAFVGVVIGLLNVLGIATVARILADENLKIKQDRGKLFGCMSRTIQIIETIKAGASEAEALVHLTGHQARLTNATQAVGTLGSLLILLPPFFSVVTTAAILGIGGARVMEGVMSVGALVAFQALMANFQRPFGDLVRLGSTVQSLQAELGRLDDVHRHEIDPLFAGSGAEATDPAPQAITRLSGHLELRNVTFGFNRTLDEPLIQKFSLDLRPGRRVALVGDSGSGKSTIGRLVAGLYRPWEGEILYDGKPIDQIPREVFTQQVALVDDQAFLFNGTIRDNLTLWDETIPEGDMHRAAVDAAVHRDVIARRGAYQARLAEGARNLSGGQRQRLEIARALIRNPALIVLDEATSALDPVTEAVVDDNLRRRGCTCLIIAHRLSTIRDCDEIIVLRQGRVIQRGTHEELMAKVGGFYYELQSLQERVASAEPLTNRRQESRDSRAISKPAHRNGSTAHAPLQLMTAIGAAGTGTDSIISAPPVVATSEPLEDDPTDLLEGLSSLGDDVRTAGNLPLPLNDAGVVWQVVEGQVDLFYLSPEKGAGAGRRRHLCRIEQGGTIFAMENLPSVEHGEFLAVGAGPACLRRVARSDLMRLSFNTAFRRDVAGMIDDWVDRISRAIELSPAPADAVRLQADEVCELQARQSAVSRSQVLWIRHDGPPLRFFGAVDVPECPHESRFPLSSHAWVRFDVACMCHMVDTETLMEDGDPWSGLRRFHAAILDAIALAGSRELSLAESRRELSVRHDGVVFRTALATLAGTDDGQPAPIATAAEADPLFEACRVVGKAQGITVKRPPMAGPSDLRFLARTSGFRTRRVQLTMEWWKSDSGHLLGFLADGGHPVALLRSPRGEYRIVEPFEGRSRKVTPEVAQTLSPGAVMFYRCLTGARLSARDLVRTGLAAVHVELKTLITMGLAGGLIGLVAPWIVGVAIDDVIPRADFGQLGQLCAFLLAIGLVVALFQAIQGLALVRIKGRLEAELLGALWDRLLNLPARFFANKASGDLALRAMGLARIIEIFVSSWVASMLVSLFSLVNVIVLFVYNAQLALVAVGLLLVSPLALAVIVHPLWRAQRMILRTQGEIAGFLLLMLGGVSRIRVAGAENRAFARWVDKYRRQLALAEHAQRLTDRLILFNNLWPLLILMVVFGVVIRLGPDAMTAGEFMAFNVALAQSLAAVMGIGHGLLPLLQAVEQYERFRPILKAKPENTGIRTEPVALAGALRVGNVSFRYDPDGPLTLDAVDLQVRPGEFVAIVGSSGSGKSTLLRLLLGFETPS
jgi:NHLM bacteriocin system ABC transporter peptidase/ATP-binding protein